MAGEAKEFLLPTKNASAYGIARGPDGNLWFTEYYNPGIQDCSLDAIGRITPTGDITEFRMKTQGTCPLKITAGPDDNLWFLENGVGKIGRITMAGAVTEFSTAHVNSSPVGITAGSDGNLWFTESLYDKIGRITPAGEITEFDLPTTGNTPSGIAKGSDGNLWFTENSGCRIGRITPQGQLTEFPLPSTLCHPTAITSGPDGNLWFASANSVGRITTEGKATEFTLPTEKAWPGDIVTGPDSNIWFLEVVGKNLACIVPGGEPTGGSGGSATGGTGGVGASGTPTPGTFTRIGDVGTARYNHTATLLKNGKVLIAGGTGLHSTGETTLASTELFSPDSMTFTAAGTMTVMRSQHVATLLADGKVLLVSGYASIGPSSSMCGRNAELFDPADGSFTATSPPTAARCENTATLLNDGRVLIYGVGVTVENADLYDPATRTFSATAKMSASRFGHTATLLADGRVLIAGGVGVRSNVTTYLATAELYDPATNTFVATGNLAKARAYHTASLLADGTVLIAGGLAGTTSTDDYLPNAELYDPRSGRFTSAARLNVVRIHHAAMPFANGRVLLLGGVTIGGRTASAELYDPADATFVTTGSLSAERTSFAATALANGQILVTGGEDFTSVLLARAEIYQ